LSAFESLTSGERAPIRVAVVEDHALLAHALTRALREIGVFADSVVPTGDAEILDGVAGIRPDVVLLDLDLGALGSSVRLIPDLRALGCKVVVVTGEESRARWGECIEAGADAVVSKALSFDDLLGRVTNILDESKGVSSEQDELRACAREHRREQRTRLEQFEALTPRECDVLDALTQGRSAEEIAAGAFVSLATARTHIRSILQKLGVSSQLAAVATAHRCGWRNRQD
jgi:two-component system, NarL family, nitrate/nitrite response regulator NarL